MKTLCESMDSQHEHLRHADVRCLSRRQVLSPISWAQERNKTERNSQLAEFLGIWCGWVSCIFGAYILPFEQA